jgi:hypothetical protein
MSTHLRHSIQFFRRPILLACLATLVVQTPGRAATAIELGTPFADNAILQRDMPVPVWGWSKPGDKITVLLTFGFFVWRANFMRRVV